MCRKTVRRGRLAYGRPSRQRVRALWPAGLDWSKPDGQIAKEVGVWRDHVSRKRRNSKLPPALATKVDRFRQHAAEKGNIDWRLRDVEIVRIYGVARQEVGKLRRKLAAPLSLFVELQPTAACIQASSIQQGTADRWKASLPPQQRG